MQNKVIEQVSNSQSQYLDVGVYMRKFGSSRSLSLIDILKVVLLFWSFVSSRSFQSFSKE